MFRKRDPLDEGIYRWSPKDIFTFRHLTRSVGIFGQIGSGKSSGSGYQLGKAIVRHPNTGGLILSSKQEDLETWRKLIPPDRLEVFGPDHPHRFNALDFVGNDSRMVTNCLLTISESLGGGGDSGGGGEDGKFWKLNKERTLYCACEVLRIAYGKIKAPQIQQFIVEAATNTEVMFSEDHWPADKVKERAASRLWAQGFHRTTFKIADAKQKNEIEKYDFGHCLEFWVKEWPRMSDKMRSGIVADIMATLHPFNSGVTRILFSTDTTISPPVIDQRKWVVVDMNLDEFGDSARVVLGGWKFLTELYILRRRWKPGDAVTPIWCDEAQEVVNSMDGRFLAKCRSHGGCLIFLTQSIHSYYSALKGKGGESQTKALLTNFYNIIAHQVGDPETAKYMSDMLGQRKVTEIGGSESSGKTAGDSLFGGGGFSANFSERWEPILQPNRFMAGLRTGGGEQGCLVDGWLLREGTAKLVSFSQK